MQANGSTSAAPPKPKAPKVAYKQPEKGTTSLPAARVQRLIKADRDIQKCAKDAVFATSVATVSRTNTFGLEANIYCFINRNISFAS